MSSPIANTTLAARAGVITGAGGGVGRALAQAFAASGARVLLVGRDAHRLRTTVELLGARGGDPTLCQTLVCDVTTADAAEVIDRTMRKRFDAWNLTVNSAGVYHEGDFLRTPPQAWHQTLDTNLTAPFRLAQAMVRGLAPSGAPGNVINIGSIHAQVGDSRAVAQCAAKAGVVGLTRALAEACRPYNVRVNAVSPGAIASDASPGEPQGASRRVTATQVAQLAVFLASEAASLVTGCVLEAYGDTRPVIFTPPADDGGNGESKG